MSYQGKSTWLQTFGPDKPNSISLKANSSHNINFYSINGLKLLLLLHLIQFKGFKFVFTTEQTNFKKNCR